MIYVDAKISLSELKNLSKNSFGNLVKAVVDVEREVMVVGGELHSDEEKLLLEKGSQQQNLWGINLYTDMEGDDFVEFDSMINVRPSQNNLTRSVDDPLVREKIVNVVDKLVDRER